MNMMTKEELLQKLTDIEWDDFECKAAQDKLPEDVWSTVSAFSNTSGGWVVFGIRQRGKQFDIQGINNGEKTESDFLNTLRNGQKFNMRLSAQGKKYNFDGKLVLAFFVPSSMVKPIYYGSPINTFIRTGSGDRRATEAEVMAMMRDQAFGCKSEQMVEGTSFSDINKGSLETYRNQIRNENPSFPYKNLPDEQFCEKVGITKEGKMTIGQAMVQPVVQAMVQPVVQVQRLVNVIREDACTFSEILRRLHLKGRNNVVVNYLKPAIEGGYVLRSYPDKPNHPNQRYYLSEKGLKLVK